MPTEASDFLLDPVVVVRGNGERTIATLEEAADFLRKNLDAAPHANPEGVLWRIEAAISEDEKKHAADAFRGWAQAAELLIGARWRS